MILFEDTRNQLGKHKRLNADLQALGHIVERTKLYVGDYADASNMKVYVDTKKDWVELAGNICGKQHERFRNECLRAQNMGYKLIFLVEEEIPIEEWKTPRKRNGEPICNVPATTLQKAMQTMSLKYGVEFKNCRKKDTAKVLVELLSGGQS